MENRFNLIRDEQFLSHLTTSNFAERAALHLGEINAINPFREGNGRTQQLFLEILAQRAGHSILRERIDSVAWNEAVIKSFRGDYGALQDVINKAIVSGTG